MTPAADQVSDAQMAEFMTSVAQILDTVKGQEWKECWGEWDQKQRDFITRWMTDYYSRRAELSPPAGEVGELIARLEEAADMPKGMIRADVALREAAAAIEQLTRERDEALSKLREACGHIDALGYVIGGHEWRNMSSEFQFITSRVYPARDFLAASALPTKEKP